MKVGDLVRLSAYGQARDYNQWLMIEERVGLVIKVKLNRSYPYQIQWTKAGCQLKTHSRLELKHARR